MTASPRRVSAKRVGNHAMLAALMMFFFIPGACGKRKQKNYMPDDVAEMPENVAEMPENVASIFHSALNDSTSAEHTAALHCVDACTEVAKIYRRPLLCKTSSYTYEGHRMHLACTTDSGLVIDAYCEVVGAKFKIGIVTLDSKGQSPSSSLIPGPLVEKFRNIEIKCADNIYQAASKSKDAPTDRGDQQQTATESLSD